MANTFMTNVPENFDMNAFADELCNTYQIKGYNARAMKMKNSVKVTIEKGRGGLNTVLGMDEGITVTFMKQGAEMLTANYSDASWTGKIVGCIIGWFLCFIPIITAIIGIVRQLDLPKKIENDILMQINNND